MAQRRYKWIFNEIESLNPETEYERIWALSTCYYVNNFMMNFVYTIGFPHFILPPHGGETVTRGGYGKLIKKQQKRADDTLYHFWKWFEKGPSSPEVQHSVDQVNKIHLGIAKKMVGSFSHIDDFIYTMCWIAADMHRLRLRLGLPGFSEKQQIACHRYWREMAKLFISENGNVDHEFPEDFNGMLQYMADYEAVDWAHSPEGAAACEALLNQFATRWFPVGFRWAGRTMILSMLDEPARRVHRLKKPNGAMVKMNEIGLKAVLWSKENVLPDPKVSTPEKNRLKESRKSSHLQDS